MIIVFSGLTSRNHRQAFNPSWQDLQTEYLVEENKSKSKQSHFHIFIEEEKAVLQAEGNIVKLISEKKAEKRTETHKDSLKHV